MSDQIRADYEKLEEIATRFKGQSSTTFEMMKQMLDVAGAVYHEWVGKGSDAFYHEMEEVVVPGMKRLVAALDEAGNVTRKIAEVLKAAEGEAAAPFRGGESASGVAGGVAGGEGETAVNGNSSTNSATASSNENNNDASRPSSIKDKLDLGREVIQKPFQIRGILNGPRSIAELGRALGRNLKGLNAVGPALTVIGGFFNTGFEFGERVKRGEDVATALSLEAGEGTTEILARLALYSNPFTGVPTFVHDVANVLGIVDTDVIEKVGEVVGRAANVASDAVSDAMVAVLNNPETDVQIDFPRTTIRDFERAGQPIPKDVAQRLFVGLVQNEGFQAANQFISDFADKNNVRVIKGIGGLSVKIIDK